MTGTSGRYEDNSKVGMVQLHSSSPVYTLYYNGLGGGFETLCKLFMGKPTNRKDKDMKDKILTIVNKLLTYGLGAVLIVAGIVLITLGNHLGYIWPDYIIGGGLMLGIGAVLYITDMSFRHVEKMKGEK